MGRTRPSMPLVATSASAGLVRAPELRRGPCRGARDGRSRGAPSRRARGPRRQLPRESRSYTPQRRLTRPRGRFRSPLPPVSDRGFFVSGERRANDDSRRGRWREPVDSGETCGPEFVPHRRGHDLDGSARRRIHPTEGGVGDEVCELDEVGLVRSPGDRILDQVAYRHGKGSLPILLASALEPTGLSRCFPHVWAVPFVVNEKERCRLRAVLVREPLKSLEYGLPREVSRISRAGREGELFLPDDHRESLQVELREEPRNPR